MVLLISFIVVVSELMVLARASRDSESPTLLPMRYPPSFISGNQCRGSEGETPLMNHALRQISADVRSRALDIAPVITRHYANCGPGKCIDNPVFYCNELREMDELAPSGLYWLRVPNRSSVSVYCEFDRPCNCSDSANRSSWMRIAFHNMSDPNHECPYNLHLNETSGKRLCGTKHRGCTSVFFDTMGLSYESVCGRVIGVQFGEPNAFRPYFKNRELTLEDPFVDGVILTHGHAPRTHIWSFAVAEDETEYDDEACPCTRTDREYEGLVPEFIGDDYFCDTGSRSRSEARFYTEDPLWDGGGCGDGSLCCVWRDPPWFCKRLAQSTQDEIEMRVCTDSSMDDEHVLLQHIELYIQ